MSGIYEMTFYAISPKGQVHAVKTRTSTDIRSMVAFKKMWPANGYRTQYDHELARAARITKQILAEQENVESLKSACGSIYPEFDGTIVNHPSVKAFFDAIGYDADAKRRVRNAYSRWKKAAFTPDGAIRFVDTSSFRVAFGA